MVMHTTGLIIERPAGSLAGCMCGQAWAVDIPSGRGGGVSSSIRFPGKQTIDTFKIRGLAKGAPVNVHEAAIFPIPDMQTSFCHEYLLDAPAFNSKEKRPIRKN